MEYQNTSKNAKIAPENPGASPVLTADVFGNTGQKSPGRTRMSNGSIFLSGIDGRNLWVRRCKEIISAHLQDLGGPSNTSVAERSIIRRASALTVELERLEKKFALAGAASSDDLDLYSRVASNLRRLLESVGLKRRSRDITPPSLVEILRAEEAR